MLWSVKLGGKQYILLCTICILYKCSTNVCVNAMFIVTCRSFIESCPTGCEFVLKAPYVTNRQHFHTYPKDVVTTMKNIRTARKKMFVDQTCYHVPYLILQVITLGYSYYNLYNI